MEKLNTYSLQLSAFGFQHLAISGNSHQPSANGHSRILRGSGFPFNPSLAAKVMLALLNHQKFCSN
ncbi:MAG: hypothetical protein KAW12_16155, partial [Candidatus Aminicenantes bacterium]|nr:hypothetical protein [Candidatus Aminicenantes bacterium]